MASDIFKQMPLEKRVFLLLSSDLGQMETDLQVGCQGPPRGSGDASSLGTGLGGSTPILPPPAAAMLSLIKAAVEMGLADGSRAY